MAGFEEKTEQPTGRKRQKAREQGQVARSKELTSMASTAGMLTIFYFIGSTVFIDMGNLVKDFLYMNYSYDLIKNFRIVSIRAVEMLAPFFAAGVFMAVFSNVVQGGFVFKPPKLDLQRLNPLEGAKKMFLRHALMELLKGLAKFSVGAFLLYMVLKRKIGESIMMQDMDVALIGSATSDIVFYAVKVIFLTFLVIAILDYVNEKWKFERSLRMTKQEVKDEYKETEGNPMVKARIRSIQREAARKRMMQEVPQATVVITNPTHFAVALKYTEGRMSAPKVVAKGAGFVARKIREIALKHYVPIVEDKPLARALFRVELGREIPHDLYRAVARILAYVYRLRGATA